MPTSDKLTDQLLDGNNSPEDFLGEDGLQAVRRIAEPALDAELDPHSGLQQQ